MSVKRLTMIAVIINIMPNVPAGTWSWTDRVIAKSTFTKTGKNLVKKMD